MSGKSPIFIGLSPNQFIEQEGSYFSNHDYGFDTGSRRFLTHPSTPESRYPQVGNADSQHKSMFAVSVVPRGTESTAVEIEVRYKGVTRAKPVKVLPGADAHIFNSGGFDFQIPIPTSTFIYTTTTKPTLAGVGSGFSSSLLPAPPIWSITIPSSVVVTRNITLGWVLQSRTWDDAAGIIWEVTERCVYNFDLAA